MKKVIFAVILVLCFVTVCFAYDFTITVPDQHVITVRDSLCIHWDYEGNKICTDPEDPETCETKKEFIERKTKARIKTIVNNFLQETAVNVARRDAPQLDF